ncbi:TetR/AcrR family transcriptional regulator [Rhodopseudomonas palustris]|uniref:TetR/AcrR family transcriptional regulator n=1 Tax=Rhodopseudomonas palustris TaxID=1076 RepID=UPI000E5C0049|nr:TetR/AcrR family transcriptional regulator [Rhodopseudomonas palustris]QLH70935.1 TetR/AcrR family transcriptional regulator [Rhodopseudomonas palustris]RIA02019.1 TetR/AcrR family transcriptional regulator [Rhodopseudomonas palustris]
MMQKSDPTLDHRAARPRGRPRAFDRARALAQATRLFWIKGYEATSIADLTEAMGIGAPSLYAAFGSKEALYGEAVRHYEANYEQLVWGRFRTATTAREALEAFLLDSASALTGAPDDHPLGCMVTLSAVGSEGHAELGELVRSARAVTLQRLEARLSEAIAVSELPPSTDIHAVARFYQAVQAGMSILARDGASRAELEAVARLALARGDV